MKVTLIAKPGAGAAITSAAVLGLLAGCGFAWLVFSTHLSAQYPQLSFAPIAAVIIVYLAIAVPRLGRTAFPFPLVLTVAVFAALLTLAVSAVLIEMILCHYDRYACINL